MTVMDKKQIIIKFALKLTLATTRPETGWKVSWRKFPISGSAVKELI